MSLKDLKTINFDSVTLEDAVDLSAKAKATRAEFEALRAPVPEWFDIKQRELGRFIDMKLQDDRDKAVMKLRTQLAGLETNTEKRLRLQAELDALTGTPKPVGAGASPEDHFVGVNK